MGQIRDLERTREALLKAALTEFSAHGLAGARTDAIARRAGVAKRMLFYCFGSKEGIYREVMRRKLMERAAFAEALSDDLGDALLRIYDISCRDLEWVRMLEWEALSGRGRTLVSEKDRKGFVTSALARFGRFHRDGVVSGDTDAVQLFTSFIALAVFPMAFPQLIRMATGLDPLDPKFVEARRRFLRWVGGRIQNDRAEADSHSALRARTRRARESRAGALT